MTNMMTMMGGPMMLAIGLVWLLAVAFLGLGCAAFVKYLREAPQR
jgi:uncharacterized membrane protein HdeD (DUF308 family)